MPGVVDLASFNLMNTVLAATAPSRHGDWLLVHVGADYATLAVVRGADLVFFRNRGAAGPAELADLVHQTAMYHEDRLGGGGFSRVVMAGAALRGPETGGMDPPQPRGAPAGAQSSRSTSGPPWRSTSGSAPGRSCSTRWRPASACCCARGSP